MALEFVGLVYSVMCLREVVALSFTFPTFERADSVARPLRVLSRETRLFFISQILYDTLDISF